MLLDTIKYRTVIGLEIHVQLMTNRKMFSEEGAIYGAPPNTQTSVTTLAHPGTLPSINKQAISYAIRMGLACGSTITEYNLFARKNYYYPDLPKGYQISQDKTPLCTGGSITVTMPQGKEKTVNLERIHLEEDTGKSIHTNQVTLVNFDRAGTPLIEVVTKPELSTAEEVYYFLYEIRRMVRYLAICDGNMELGSLRCDANVSIMPEGSQQFGNKVELKNMNSMRHAMHAIEHEVSRQQAILNRGEEVVSETRSYDQQTGETVFQRKKEGVNDYRYFPEQDLSPVVIDKEWIFAVQNTMPVLPRELMHRFISRYGLSREDSVVLIEEKELGLFFEDVCQHTGYYKGAANWILGPVKSWLNKEKCTIHQFPLSSAQVAQLTELVAKGLLSFTMAATELFPLLLQTPDLKPEAIAKKRGWLQVADTKQLAQWIAAALAKYPDEVAAYKKGKTGLTGLFMGEVMKMSQRRAHPEKTMELLCKQLEE